MIDEVGHEPAHDPQDLERFLVSRERAGDIDGMTALYESDAVLDCGDGQLVVGKEAIRAYYAGQVTMGHRSVLLYIARLSPERKSEAVNQTDSQGFSPLPLVHI